LKLLLDTNVISKMVRGRELAYRQNAELSIISGNEHSTSVIVKFELEYGAIKGPYPISTREKQATVLDEMDHIYDVNKEDAQIAARIRLDLELRGERIGEYDVIIAAQAIRTGSKLVSNNLKHFDRVAGLEVIDWSKV
jgi:tRNA(fMet)-specific endonuclease VapC